MGPGGAGRPRRGAWWTSYNKAFVEALERRARPKPVLPRLMAEPVPSSSAEFGALMARELAKYEKPVKASGAKVD